MMTQFPFEAVDGHLWELASQSLERATKKLRFKNKARVLLTTAATTGRLRGISQASVTDFNLGPVPLSPPQTPGSGVRRVIFSEPGRPIMLGSAFFKDRAQCLFITEDEEWSRSTFVHVFADRPVVEIRKDRQPSIEAPLRQISYGVSFLIEDVDSVIEENLPSYVREEKERARIRAIRHDRSRISFAGWHRILRPFEELAAQGRLADKVSVHGHGAIAAVADVLLKAVESAGESTSIQTARRRAKKLLIQNEAAVRRPGFDQT